jgi:hexosaminidase
MQVHGPIFFVSALLLAIGSSCNSPGDCLDATAVSLTWECEGNDFSRGISLAEFRIKNNGKQILDDHNWKLYFNQGGSGFRNGSISEKVRFDHVNGDLMVLSPTSGFRLGPGEEIKISYEKSGTIIKEVESPAGPFFVFRCTIDVKEKAAAPGEYKVLPFPGLDRIFPEESGIPLPDAGWVYRMNQGIGITDLQGNPGIIPRPRHTDLLGWPVSLDSAIIIRFSGELENEAKYLAKMLERVLGSIPHLQQGSGSGTGVISLAIDSDRAKSPESYVLIMDPRSGIRISSPGEEGIFYGIQSFLALLPPQFRENHESKVEINAVNIIDSPLFEYRGVMLDVARNFHSPETIRKLMDAMALYKLNTLHLSLTNDEGWRLEIPGLPELTNVGARRGYTISGLDYLPPAYGSGPDPEQGSGSGFLSREEFIELLKYADSRHIRVIPEVNFPGHARAAIYSMEARYRDFSEEGNRTEAEKYRLIDPEDESVYRSAQDYNDNVVCVCRESATQFYEFVVEAIADMYREAGLELTMMHTGGDEVPAGSWTASPLCSAFLKDHQEISGPQDLQGWFEGRLMEMLKKKGIRMAGWEEVALMKKGGHRWDPNPEYAGTQMVPFVWNSRDESADLAYRLANAGFPVVLCNVDHYYFDLAYNHHPAEPGLYWGGYVDTRRAFTFAPFDVFHTILADQYGILYETDYDDSGREHLQPEAEKQILGIQGQLWSETLTNNEMLEYYYFPKMLGLAERAWSGQAEWGAIVERDARLNALTVDWNRFANLIGQHEMPRLDHLFGGYNYRIPPPGGVIRGDTLYANTTFPGLEIRYTTDGSVPTGSSEIYSGPVPAAGKVLLRSFNKMGRGSRVSEVSAGS